MVHHFILCNFTLHHPRNTLHAGNYLRWTWDNFLRFCVRVCAWEEVRIIWWDLWFFSLAIAYNHFLSDTTILGYFICSPFCSSLISVGIGHFIFFMGNKHDIYSVLLHGRNLLSCPSFWKDNSHSEKDEAVYWFSCLMREKYQSGCWSEMHLIHPKLNTDDFKDLPSKQESST